MRKPETKNVIEVKAPPISGKEMKKGITEEIRYKLIAIFDTHIPHNLPLEGFIEFLKDEKPTHLLIGGDFVNLDSLNHWNDDQGNLKEKEGKRLEDDISAANSVLLRLMKAVGEGCKIVYLEGNHELWAKKYVEKNPEMEGVVSIERQLKLKEKGIQYIELDSDENFYKLGNIVYTHGDEARGQYHARKMMDIFNSKVRYGHRHTRQMIARATKTGMPDVDAENIPAMCDNEKYMKGLPTGKRSGFHIVYYLKDGSEYEYTIEQKDGRFVFNNKIYGQKEPKKRG
jgi:UDP-2,3-diacylglucosamine pyrophosphatase LpxH